MSSSRRRFRRDLAATGAIMPVSPAASDASLAWGAERHVHRGMEITIGHVAISRKDRDRQAIDDLSKFGIPGIQLRASAGTDFPNPRTLRDLAAQNHLTRNPDEPQFAALRSIQFHGPGVIGLDGEWLGEVRTPTESALIGKRYFAKSRFHV